MKRLFLIPALLFLSHAATAQDYEWIKQFKGGNNEDVETDASGNTLVITSYVDSYTCGNNTTTNPGSHPFTAKYDAAGNCLWMKPRPYEHVATTMDESGNYYLAGNFPGTINYEGVTLKSKGVQDLYLAKYNSSGTFQWVKQLGGPGMEMMGDIAASNGTIYFTGSFGTSIQVGGNTYNASNPSNSNNFFLAKFDAQGNFAWLRKGVSNSANAGWKVGIDDQANAYVHGSHSDTLKFGSTQVDFDGSPYDHRFIVKYNAAGTDLWAIDLGSNFRTGSHQMKSDRQGNVYVGWSFVYGEFTIRKYNTNGNYLWSASAGASYSTGLREFKFNPAGYLYVTGNMWPEGDFGDTHYEGVRNRMYVTRISPQGDVEWVITASGDEEEALSANSQALSVSNDGKIYVIGELGDVAHFGSFTVRGSNGNIFLAKIHENVLLGAAGVWKYLDNGSDQGTAWRNTGFNDASWKNGNTQLGYGDGDESTVVSYGSDASNKYITTYFRRIVNIPNPGDYSSFELKLLRDDGAVVYINGTEVLRSNMPGGAITYSTKASAPIDGAGESAFTTYPIPVSKFVSGNNCIAVEIHQSSHGSSDISFDLKLKGVSDNQPPPVVCQGTGNIYREFWNNVPGDHVSQIPLNNAPNGSGQLNVFEGPLNYADNYGDRIRGYLCPPYTGNYTFWIAADDDAELWLSTDANPANKQKIAFVSGWTNSREWEKYPSQKSAAIQLVAGGKYYIETLHKEATGGDNLAVGWQLPNGEMERPIPGNRLSPFTPPAADQNLVNANGTWKYLDNGSNQGTAWRSPGFNDGSWKSGKAELGYGDGDEVTTVSYGSNASKKYITTYFRKSFNVADLSAFDQLELSLVRDDGAVVYLNGSEVYRNNMPTGTIYYNTVAPSYIDGGNESAWLVTNISKSKLVQGNNVIAVEIHQNSPTSSDISFNLKLKGIHNGGIAGKQEEEQPAQINDTTTASRGDIVLYPNPNTGSFTLEYCNEDVKENNVQVEVLSPVGQLVLQKTLEKKRGCVLEVIELDKDLAPGIYIMNIIQDGNKESKRVVLTR